MRTIRRASMMSMLIMVLSLTSPAAAQVTHYPPGPPPSPSITPNVPGIPPAVVVTPSPIASPPLVASPTPTGSIAPSSAPEPGETVEPKVIHRGPGADGEVEGLVLPFTGAQVALFLLLGFASVGLGLILNVLGRGRRSSK
jgi:hypothetical protein